MRSIADHCHLLSEAIFGIGEQNLDFLDVLSYLNIASGIRSVEFSRWELEYHHSLCSNADDYQDDQDALWSALTHRLSVFLLVWAAVESYKKSLALIPPPKTPGKKTREIDSLCNYLSINYKECLPEKFYELLSEFRCVSSQSRIGRRSTASILPQYMRPAGEGLYLVYEYRNAFAHGDFAAPNPDGDPAKHPDIKVIALATRIVLLSLQMITLCHYPNDKTVELPSFLLFEDDGCAPSVRETFLNLHMESFDDIRDRAQI